MRKREKFDYYLGRIWAESSRLMHRKRWSTRWTWKDQKWLHFGRSMTWHKAGTVSMWGRFQCQMQERGPLLVSQGPPSLCSFRCRGRECRGILLISCAIGGCVAAGTDFLKRRELIQSTRAWSCRTMLLVWSPSSRWSWEHGPYLCITFSDAPLTLAAEFEIFIFLTMRENKTLKQKVKKDR